MRRRKNKKIVGIYLWKLILIIITFFGVFLSVECFLLIEKTVKNWVAGFSEEHNSTIIASNKENNSDSEDINTTKDISINNESENISNTSKNIDEEPTSDEEVFAGEPTSPTLVCTDESHTHTDICYDDNITQEERMVIYNLVQEIDKMPTYQEAINQLNAYTNNYNDTSNASDYNSYKTYLNDLFTKVESENRIMTENISPQNYKYISNQNKLQELLKLEKIKEALDTLDFLPLKSDFNDKINDLKNKKNVAEMIEYLTNVSNISDSANQAFTQLNIDVSLYQYIINYNNLTNLQGISNNLTKIANSTNAIKNLPMWTEVTKKINTYKINKNTSEYITYLNELSNNVNIANQSFITENLDSIYYTYVINYENYQRLLDIPKILKCAEIIKDLPNFEDVKININKYISNNQVDEIIEYLTNISNKIEYKYNLFLAENLRSDDNTYIINYSNLVNLYNMYLSEILQFTIQINTLPLYEEIKDGINIYKEPMDVDGCISYLESALTSNIDEIYNSLENSENLTTSHYKYIINFENLENLHDIKLEKIKKLLNQIEELSNLENINLSDSTIRNKIILASQNYKELDLENPSSVVFIINIAELRMLEESMTAVDTNIEITVQYYANIDILNSENSGNDAELQLIDTSDKKMPENKWSSVSSPNDNNLKSIYIDKSTGKIRTTKKLVEIYKTHTMKFDRYFNDFSINNLLKFTAFYDTLDFSYELKEIWVLKNGKNPESTNPDDFIIYEFRENLYLTRDLSAQESKDSVFVYNNAYVRYIYDIKENDDNTNERVDIPANFYDYDISNGLIYRVKPNGASGYNNMTSGDVFDGDTLRSDLLTWCGEESDWDGHIYTYTQEAGINSSGNYDDESGIKLAFGNASTGTDLGRLEWVDKKGVSNYLNKYNNRGYKGCTFGLVTGISEDGQIQYASGIQVPKLFDEGPATGKKAYDNGEYSLNFAKYGDTYSLSAVNDTVAINLEKFTNPSNSKGTYNNIWTNNFWPMDSAPSFGTGTHDVKFGGTETATDNASHQIRYGPLSYSSTSSNCTFPESDDGKYHNGYFGMHFEIKFNLSKDYTGPLEYYFFGDDDMWVFLDNTLIIDIGGIHSSTGAYANLWDYLNKGDEGEHSLKFFFTERGASGSTCWMRFTLPEVGDKKVNHSLGKVRIEKEVIGLDTIEEFQFTTTLFNKENDEVLKEYYYYDTYDSNGVLTKENGLFKSGDSFLLKNGEYVIIKSLPSGTKYTVEEVPNEKYIAFSQNSSGSISEGDTANVKFTNFYNYKTAKVIKNWNDDNDYAQVRPEEIEVKLCAMIEDGEDCEEYIKETEEYINFVVTLKDVGDWTYEWKKLPKYKVNYNTDGTVSDMKEIQYTIEEIYTDELSQNYYKLSSSTENNVTTITNFKYRELTLTKVDFDHPNIKLGGAEFKLQKLKKVNDVWEVDTDFEPISATTSIDEEDFGQAIFSGLKIGKYILVEEKTPDGYNLNTKMEEIEVTEDTTQTIEIKFVDQKRIVLPFTGGAGINLFIISGLSLIILTILKLRKVRIVNYQNLKPKRRRRKTRK